MKTPPRVRLVQSWQTYSKGMFLRPTAMLRNWLIATGRAVLDEEVKATAPVCDVAVADPPVKTQRNKGKR